MISSLALSLIKVGFVASQFLESKKGGAFAMAYELHPHSQ